MTSLQPNICVGCPPVVGTRIDALSCAGGLVLVAFSLGPAEIAAGQHGRAMLGVDLGGISSVPAALPGVLPLIQRQGQLDHRQAHSVLPPPTGRTTHRVAQATVPSIAVVAGVLVYSLMGGRLGVVDEHEAVTGGVAACVFGALAAILPAAVSALMSATTTSMTSVTMVGLFFNLRRLAPQGAVLAHRHAQEQGLLDMLFTARAGRSRFQRFDLAGVGDSFAAAAL